MSLDADDPTVIRSVAVTADDLVSALEMNVTSSKTAVLRVTPPFSGRMRARLHVDSGEPYEQEPQPIHIDPTSLVVDPPRYPRPAETEDELRNDPETSYSVERHHERHAEAVKQWRDAIPSTVPDRVPIETAAGRIELTITLLGEIE